MKFILICILFISKTVFAQEGIIISESNITTVRNNYSITHPSAWTIDTSKTLGMDMLLRSPLTDSLDDFSENVNVFIQDLNGQNYTLLKMGQESETLIKNMITDVEMIESKLESTGQEPYYKLAYKGRQGKFSLITIQRYYLINQTGFALTLTIKNGNEKEYVTIGEKIFDSFQFEKEIRK